MQQQRNAGRLHPSPLFTNQGDRMRQLKALLQIGFSMLTPLMAVVGATLITVGCSATGGHQMTASPSRTKAASIPVIDAVKVVSQRLDMVIPLPAELLAYQAVAIYPKVTGFVQWI